MSLPITFLLFNQVFSRRMQSKVICRSKVVAMCALLNIVLVPRLLVANWAPALGVPQLFVDDDAIVRRVGTVRTIHPAKKLDGPVLEPDLPWEGERVYLYGTVQFDTERQEYRMWYLSKPASGGRDERFGHDKRALVLYATSRDGIHWIKPTLGIYEFDGSRENNIVNDVDSPSVLVDFDDSNSSARYTMIGQSKKTFAHIFQSDDGVHWTAHPFARPFKTKDTITWTRSPVNGQYLAFFKLVEPHRGHRRRVIYLTTSDDLKTWTEPSLVLAPDRVDDQWAVGEVQHTDYYSMSAFPYGGQFLGLVPTFNIERQFEHTVHDQSADDGPIYVQLVHSRDGRTWRHMEQRTPVIANGPAEFDAGCILGVANSPVISGDEMWFYYTGVTTTHGGTLPAKRITIGRAAWRLDGMVSLDATHEEAIVETTAFSNPGEKLVVNADATRGRLLVEVVDSEGSPMEGYGTSDCVPLMGDSVSHEVRWKNYSRLVPGQTIRVRFHLKNTKLYSYTLK